jgi:hypothetical protein
MYKRNLASTIGIDYIMADKKPVIRIIAGFLNRSNI